MAGNGKKIRLMFQLQDELYLKTQANSSLPRHRNRLKLHVNHKDIDVVLEHRDVAKCACY